MDIFVQLTLNGIIAGSIYALVAIGFNLIYGTVRFFDIGYGALTAVGGYIAFLFSRQLGMDLSVSLIVSDIVWWGSLLLLVIYVLGR